MVEDDALEGQALGLHILGGKDHTVDGPQPRLGHQNAGQAQGLHHILQLDVLCVPAQGAEDAAAALKAAERGWEEAVPENAAERAGALLFAAANAMRLAGVDAEEALTFASGRFRQELLQKTEDSDGQERPATV